MPKAPISRSKQIKHFFYNVKQGEAKELYNILHQEIKQAKLKTTNQTTSQHGVLFECSLLVVVWALEVGGADLAAVVKDEAEVYGEVELDEAEHVGLELRAEAEGSVEVDEPVEERAAGFILRHIHIHLELVQHVHARLQLEPVPGPGGMTRTRRGRSPPPRS